ncbi:hypothetical protein THAOC_18123 [Thalassiosira oceanica]|uniref:Major facilitator superfamily (MFS) profile domain-containing protein n=1 Tax=Thalassiosira oceanica TaxID=159749 RepID=K0S8W8_THAOC|nr:hypothetical protein THAOC_18123 [Thalassiosira oceanica]|eukprot:EJK61399.1 hypothetical protein THAOC_18123 [Thalassiosira oceanica]
MGMLLDYRRMKEEEEENYDDDDDDEEIEVGARPLSEILVTLRMKARTFSRHTCWGCSFQASCRDASSGGWGPGRGRARVSSFGGGFMLVGDSLALFLVGMTLVGVGWNLSFVGPSTLVSTIHTPTERADVIGFNDGVMLQTIGVFALTGSQIYTAINSWRVFNSILIGISTLSALAAAARSVRTARRGRSKNYAADERTNEGDDSNLIDPFEASLEGSLEHILANSLQMNP